LTTDQQREIAQTYASNGASTTEICERFGIAQSVLYRLLRKQGVTLRGRVRQVGSPGRAPRRKAAARPSRGRRSAAVVAPSAAARTGSAVRSFKQNEFRVEYTMTRVVEASDINQALRQAEASAQPISWPSRARRTQRNPCLRG